MKLTAQDVFVGQGSLGSFAGSVQTTFGFSAKRVKGRIRSLQASRSAFVSGIRIPLNEQLSYSDR